MSQHEWETVLSRRYLQLKRVDHVHLAQEEMMALLREYEFPVEEEKSNSKKKVILLVSTRSPASEMMAFLDEHRDYITGSPKVMWKVEQVSKGRLRIGIMTTTMIDHS